jgi:putative MATE family efflux protein
MATKAENPAGETSGIDDEKIINAPFTEGSVFRHIIIMTLTGAVGLASIFGVDLMDMYFLSLLGEAELAAAIGFAGTILFMTSAIGIGLSIATSALTARAVGERDKIKTGTIVLNTTIFSALFASLIVLIMFPMLPKLLSIIGASGRTHELALIYMHILLPTLPFMVLGMTSSGVLRALGDARGAMFVMVTAAVVNGILDPILIFGLDMGLEGAAYASAIARVFMFFAAMRSIFRVHRLRSQWSSSRFKATLPPMLKIAGPATVTNIATPIGNAYVVSLIAQYGDSVVAGNTIVARITPVAFALFFSMSGSIGPVIGQNLGAHLYDRVQETVMSSLRFIVVYTAALWAVFYFGQDLIISIFNATNESASMIRTFCVWVVPMTAFLGALFVANAAFNNLGHPIRATIFNVSRATVGTVPFAIAGASIAGPEGVLVGQAIGSMFVAIVAVYFCFRTIRNVAAAGNKTKDAQIAKADREAKKHTTIPLMPFSSARAFQAPTAGEDNPVEKDHENNNGMPDGAPGTKNEK